MPNTKPQRPNRFITFNPLNHAVLERAASASGLTVSKIVDQLITAHAQELTLFSTWMEGLTDPQMRVMGVHALEQYGPNDLITEMQLIDKSFQPPQAVQMAAGAGLLTPDEVRQVRALLAREAS